MSRSPRRPDRRDQARGEPIGRPEGGAGLEHSFRRYRSTPGTAAQGGRMVPFAGYEMPVQYEGIMAEHLWTRENAGLFDVSHMGQLLFHGADVDAGAGDPASRRAASCSSDMRLRYSLLLDEDGGIIDDLMATRRGEHFYVVVNGATKHGDIDSLRSAAAARRSSSII